MNQSSPEASELDNDLSIEILWNIGVMSALKKCGILLHTCYSVIESPERSGLFVS